MAQFTLNPPHEYKAVDLGEDRLTLPKRITATEDARLWFARGWFHVMNYNHEEAVACFNRCRDLDAECIMASWGIGESSSHNAVYQCASAGVARAVS